MRDILRAALRGLATLAVLAAVVVPGVLFVRVATPDLPAQTPATAVPAAVSEALAEPPVGAVIAIPVLAYRDVSEARGAYVVSPQRFAEQMASVRAAGYQTVTPAALRTLLDGDATGLPARPLLLTFDAGAEALYTTVDPILAANDLRATAFLDSAGTTSNGPTSQLSRDLVGALDDSGRWTFGRRRSEARSMALERFGLAFDDGRSGARSVTSVSDPVGLPRIAVTGVMTGRDVVDALVVSHPTLPVGDLRHVSWEDPGGRCRVIATQVRIDGRGFGRCAVAGNTSMWGDYTVALGVRGASRDTTALISWRDGPHGRVELALGESSAQLRQVTVRGWEVLGQAEIEPAAVHHLRFAVDGRVVVVRVGEVIFEVEIDRRLATGALGFGVAGDGVHDVVFTVEGVDAEHDPELVLTELSAGNPGHG